MKVVRSISIGVATMGLLVAPAVAQEPSSVREASAWPRPMARDSEGARTVAQVVDAVAARAADTVSARVAERIAAAVVTPVASRVADTVADQVAERIAAAVVTPVASRVADAVAEHVADRLQDSLDNAQDKIKVKTGKLQEKEQGRAQREAARAMRALDRRHGRGGDQQSRLYEEGRRALDNENYEQAEAKFAELAKLNGSQTDAALYWQAYAENRLGKRDAALAAIADMKQRFPQSRWQKDAAALEIEVRQSSGQPPSPEKQTDEEVRMLALNGLLHSDPERAIPVLRKVLESTAAPKEKERALFVLAQSGSPQAREIIVQIARGQGNPDLQRKAIQYLAIFGDAQARQVMADVYGAPSTDASVRRTILHSYMIARDKEHLVQAAKSEKDEELKREAIRQLGVMHAENELQQLYRPDSSPEIKRALVQAFFLAGDAPKLLEVAQSDTDPELRRAAVQNLGLIRSQDAGKALETIYAKETDRGVKEQVIDALFLEGNAGEIVAIARSEKDPQLKKYAVSKLSLMHSKEATDYLMELLQK